MNRIDYEGAQRRTRGINHRVGTFVYKELGEGEPGTPGNFNLRMVWSETDFFSPRHMHNFDQVRVQIQGVFHFDADGSMSPGMVGYFPEGTLYGPQTSDEETATLVMQIGGASGAGYLSEAERIAAVDALSQQGVFRGGRYYRHADGSGPGMDGFQAAWEHAQGRRMRYPEPRLQRPLLCNPQAMAWSPHAGAAGVDEKRLWSFGPQTVALAQYRLAAGASLPLEGPLSCFVEQGSLACTPEGSADASAGLRLAHFDVLHAQSGERLQLRAREDAQVLVFEHPRF